MSTLKKQWDLADCTLVQNWFWDYDSTTAGLLMNWLWRNQLLFTQRPAAIQQGSAATQLMFNHTQRSAATTLETGHQSFSCLSTSFGSVASFSGYTVKKYPSPNIIYQKNTCCISVCHHPQTFNWILYSTKAAPAAWKQEPQQRSRCCLKENQLHHLDAPSHYAFSCYRLRPTVHGSTTLGSLYTSQQHRKEPS